MSVTYPKFIPLKKAATWRATLSKSRTSLTPQGLAIRSLRKGQYLWFTCPKGHDALKFYNSLAQMAAQVFGKGKYSIHSENNYACVKVSRV